MDELFSQTPRRIRGERTRGTAEVHQAHRLQRHPAYRRLPGRRFHQGRVEDGAGDEEDPRSEDRAGRDLRARSGYSSATPKPCMSNSRSRSPRTRRAKSCTRAPGVLVVDTREDGGYITPLDATGEDATYVSRIREDKTVKNGLAFWCVSRQSAEGRGAEYGSDRGSAHQPQAARTEKEGGLSAGFSLSDLPAAIRPPVSLSVYLEIPAKGVQIYACGKKRPGRARLAAQGTGRRAFRLHRESLSANIMAVPRGKAPDGGKVIGALESKRARASAKRYSLAAARHQIARGQRRFYRGESDFAGRDQRRPRAFPLLAKTPPTARSFGCLMRRHISS